VSNEQLLFMKRKGENMHSGFVGINSNYSALFNSGGIFNKRFGYPIKMRFRASILGANLYNTWADRAGRNQNSAEIKIVGKDRITVLPGIGHNLNVLSVSHADCSPMDSFDPAAGKHIRPTNSKIHINNNFHEPQPSPKGEGSPLDKDILSGKRNFTALGKPRGVLQGLQNVLPFKVGIINKQFFNRFSRANLGEYSADRKAHAPNTWLAAHYTGVICYAVKLFKGHFQSPSSHNIPHYAPLVEVSNDRERGTGNGEQRGMSNEQ